jgi:hypothetical protein
LLSICVSTLASQVINCFGPIPHDVQWIAHTCSLERTPQDENVIWVIISEENVIHGCGQGLAVRAHGEEYG